MMSSQDQKTILLVENEALDSMSLGKDLEKCGYTVIRANSSERAVETAGKTPGIDLILMDIDFGDGMDGAQAAEQILEKHDLPLVFILSSPDTETLEKVESITSYGFVTRNSSTAEVNSFLKMALRLFEANEKTRKELAEHKRAKIQIKERNKELHGFFKLSEVIERKSSSFDELYQEFTNILPDTLQYPEVACAKTVIGKRAYLTENFKETAWMQSAPIYVNKSEVGKIEVGYLEDYSENREDPFLTEERLLLNAFAERLGRITEHKRDKNALQESEEKHRVVFENSGTAMCIIEKDGTLSLVNAKLADLAGYAIEEIENKKTWMDFVVKEDLERMREQHELRRQNKEEALNEYEFSFIDKNHNTKDIHLFIDMIPGTDKSVASLLDITERKKAEKELIFQNVLMKTQLEVSPDGILVVDENDKIISFNQRFADIWGIPDSILSLQSGKKALEYVLPKLTNPDEFARRIHDLYENKKEKSYEEIALTDGKILELYSAPMFCSNDEYYGRIWYYRDITERKRTEEALQRSLAEKDVLLSEIHHRVKNNMTVIYSMLALQSEFKDKKKDPEVLLQDLQTRIMSMSWVHELVYESSNFAQIPSDKLFKRLADYLKRSYQIEGKEISMQVHSEDIMLDMNNSVPLTLLAAELLTNALKHAFTDRRTGRIDLSIKKQEEGFCLVVQDDGVGVPDPDKLKSPESFGCTIIHGLAGQLRGELAFSSPPEGGLKVEAWFPEKMIS